LPSQEPDRVLKALIANARLEFAPLFSVTRDQQSNLRAGAPHQSDRLHERLNTLDRNKPPDVTDHEVRRIEAKCVPEAAPTRISHQEFVQFQSERDSHRQVARGYREPGNNIVPLCVGNRDHTIAQAGQGTLCPPDRQAADPAEVPREDVSVKRVDDAAPVRARVQQIVERGREAAERPRFGRMRVDDVRPPAPQQFQQSIEGPNIIERADSPSEPRDACVVHASGTSQFFEVALVLPDDPVRQQCLVSEPAQPVVQDDGVPGGSADIQARDYAQHSQRAIPD